MDNKTLIDTLTRTTALPRKDVQALLDALGECMRTAAADQDTVAVPSFGNFEPKKRLERVMAVPSTGRRLLLPPKITLTFRPAALLKQQLRQGANPEQP